MKRKIVGTSILKRREREETDGPFTVRPRGRKTTPPLQGNAGRERGARKRTKRVAKSSRANREISQWVRSESGPGRYRAKGGTSKRGFQSDKEKTCVTTLGRRIVTCARGER